MLTATVRLFAMGCGRCPENGQDESRYFNWDSIILKFSSYAIFFFFSFYILEITFKRTSVPVQHDSSKCLMRTVASSFQLNTKNLMVFMKTGRIQL